MLLKTKVRLAVLAILLVSLLVPLAVTVFSIQADATRAVERFRTDQKSRIQDQVRDLVEMAWRNLQDKYSEVTGREFMEARFGQPMKNVVLTVERLLRTRLDLVKKGAVTMDEARAMTIADLRAMRFFDDEAYLWLQDETKPIPKMVMHPYSPMLEGKILDDPTYRCARNRGDNLFVAAAEEGRKPGGGFIDYLWPKALASGTQIGNMPKLSYVKSLSEWGWVAGIGIYVDDVLRANVAALRDDLSKLRYAMGAGGFVAVDYRGMVVQHPKVELIGRNLASDSTRPDFAMILAAGLSAKREGFFEHRQLNEKSHESERNIGYAKTFEPLGWIIAASLPIEFIEHEVKWREDELASDVRRMVFAISVFYALLMTLSVKVLSRLLGDFADFDLDAPRHTALLDAMSRPQPENDRTAVVTKVSGGEAANPGASGAAAGTPTNDPGRGHAFDDLRVGVGQLQAGVDQLREAVEKLRRDRTSNP